MLEIFAFRWLFCEMSHFLEKGELASEPTQDLLSSVLVTVAALQPTQNLAASNNSHSMMFLG